MKIISWNVNGLRAILKKNFGDFIKEYSPDILCLQETKISYDICPKIELPFKYNNFSCAEKKGYSGTAILSNVKPFDVRAIEMENHPQEGRILCANFGDFNLISTYVPNSQDELKRLSYRRKWNEDFTSLIKSIPNAIVCGDMNVAHQEIDIARPNSNHFSAGFTDEERADFTTLLNEASLTDIWREKNKDVQNRYTWWSYRFGARQKNIGWRIDYFLVANSILGKIKNAEILDKIEGSDHCPILIEL